MTQLHYYVHAALTIFHNVLTMSTHAHATTEHTTEIMTYSKYPHEVDV